MKIAIVLEFSAVKAALEQVVKVFGYTVVPPEEAEIVLVQDVGDALAWLAREKRVVQFVLLGPHAPLAEGIASNPDFAERFRMFRLFSKTEGVGDESSLFDYLKKLNGEPGG